VLEAGGDESDNHEPVLRRFGDYELLEEIARGGMGVLYRARQVSLDRTVAVKMLLAGAFARPEDIKRFRFEALAAASLQHPNIVAIHEVGLHQGQEFLAMDYVAGPTLAQFIGGKPLPAKRAVGYVKTIAEAIHYAHERGVLHRDLKPSNVLIDAFDQPRITDFGLAKRLTPSSDSEGTTQDLTLTGQVLGSPGYMAPEQAAGSHALVGRPTDVYALGAMLYHVLTARPPFTSEVLADTLHQVRFAEPVSPRLLNASVPRDLETVCLKCLDKEPRRRYATAAELADDLGRVLRDEPIHARRVSRTEKSWRWCRRNPLVASLSTASFLLLLALAIGSTVAAYRINLARRTAEAQAYTSDMGLVQQAWTEGDLERAQSLLTAHIPKPGQPDLRDFEWRYLWNLCQDESRCTITNLPNERTFLVASSASHDFVLAGSEHMVQLLDPATGAVRDRFIEPDPNRRICALACCAAATNLAVTGDSLGWISLWDLAGKTVLMKFRAHTNHIAAMSLSPDGKLLATSDGGDVWGGRLKVWNLDFSNPAGQVPVWELNRAPLQLRFHPSGNILLSDDQPFANSALPSWEAKTGRQLPSVPPQHNGHVNAIAFSPDGKFLAGAGVDNRIVIWNFPERRVQTILTNQPSHLGPVSALSFSWDSRRLASGGDDNTVRIWDLDTGQAITLRGHRGISVLSLTFAPDNRSILSTTSEELKVWGLQGRAPARVLDTHQTMRSVCLSGDFKWLVTTKNHEGGYHNPLVWEVGSDHPKFELTGLTQDPLAPSFSPDGTLFALSSVDRKIRLWDTSLWPAASSVLGPTVVLTNDFEAGCLRFSPDGKILALAGIEFDRTTPSGATKRLAFWNVHSRRKLPLLDAAAAADSEQTAAGVCTFSKDGRTLAVSYKDGRVRLWDVERERLLKEFQDFTRNIGYGVGVCFSHDDHWLATTCNSQVVLYDVADREHPKRAAAWNCRHRGTMWVGGFAPGDRSYVTSGNDGQIKFWNLATHEVGLMLVQGRGPFATLAFSRDGNTLCSSDGNGIVKFWPATPRESIPQPQRP
jgi:WD40 repeat protein/serine/threonine protein kinase